jgi:hypothetical protein
MLFFNYLELEIPYGRRVIFLIFSLLLLYHSWYLINRNGMIDKIFMFKGNWHYKEDIKQEPEQENNYNYYNYNKSYIDKCV